MLKWVFKLGVSAVALMAMTANASAEPISIALLTAAGIAATSTAVAVTTFALTTAASAALSYVGTMLTQKATTSPSGVQEEVSYGGDIPRQIAFGVCRTPGQFLYFCGVGEKNKSVNQVFALCDWVCDGLDYVYVENERRNLSSVSVVGTEHARYEVQGYGSNLIIKFFRGTMTQSADSELVAGSGLRNTGLGDWTNDHRLAGVCYVSVKYTFDKDDYQDGMPQLDFQLRGAWLYDWRLDTTNGGSGSHRWNDPTTWAFSENPIVMEYNFRRGFYRNGQKLLGMGVPASDLLHSYYTAAANVCDENVSEGSTTVDCYRCSAIVGDDAEWRASVNAFMEACAGTLIEKGGLFAPVAGASQSTVMTITDKDLQVGYDSSFSAKLPRSELANAVYGSYTNKSQNWQSDSFPPVINSTWETEDNNERLVRDLQLPQVNWAYQASRIAKIVANLGRKQAKHVGVYGPRFSFLQAGDWVNWEHSVHGNYTMIIESKEEVAPLVWRLSMRETGADAYGDAASDPVTPDPVIVTTPTYQSSFSGFVTPITITGSNGQMTPAIRITWTPPDDPSVVAVRFEYRVNGTTGYVPVIHYGPEDGIFIIQGDIMAGTSYDVRVRYMLNPDLTSSWAGPVTITTTPLHVVINSRVALDTQAYFDKFQGEVEGEALSAILEALQTAQVDEAIKVDYNSKIIAVQATQNANNASTTLSLQALATQDIAIAQLLAAVSAQAGNATANGAFKMEAVAAEGSAIATIAAFVSADNGVTFNRAGWRLDVYDSGGGVLKGRFVVEANYFAIVENSSGTPFVPFSVIGADTFIERVIVGDEILSDNFDEDANGYPLEGFRLGSDGIAKMYDGRFVDMQAKGARFTERPIFTEGPMLRNGVPVGLSFQFWAATVFAAGAGVSFSFDTDARMLGASLHRTPDSFYFNGSASARNLDDMRSVKFVYPVPAGNLLPARMIIECATLADYVELLDDGTVNYVRLDANGDITNTDAFDAPWISDLEIDPENRRGLTTIYGRLGMMRGELPFIVPDGYSYLRIAMLGAGGGFDDSGGSSWGGPGGYIIFDLPIGWAEKVKPGDVLWFIIGEAGRPYITSNTQGFGGRGQGANKRAQGGGGTFCFWKDTSTRLNIIGVAGGGGAGEGSASGGPGGNTSGATPSGGQSTGGDTMTRCTGSPWSYSGGVKRGGGGGGYEGGTYTGLTGSNRGGLGGSSFLNTVEFGLINTSQSASAAHATTGQATTNLRPAAAGTKFSGFTTCFGTRFGAGHGADSAMVDLESGGNGMLSIELIP